jgi:hypothetical protein
LTILIILGKEYKSRNSSLCSSLRPPVTSSSLRPKHSPQRPVLKHPQVSHS